MLCRWLLYGHLVGFGLLVVGAGIHLASVERLRRPDLLGRVPSDPTA